MKRIEVTINGVAYPCTPSMGAMLRFKKETGKEVTEITPGPNSFSDLCIYLWCCVASGAKREGKEFNLSLMDFADSLTPEDMQEWNDAVNAQVQGIPDNATEGEKKSL